MVTKEARLRYENKRDNKLYYKCDFPKCLQVAEFFNYPIENEDALKFCKKHFIECVLEADKK